MFDSGDKKYLSLYVGLETCEKIKEIHAKDLKNVKNLVDSLRGTVLKVKVPFRYNRVMCKVIGDKTIQSLVKGDKVTVDIKYCGWWEFGDYGGPSWKFVSLSYQE